MGVCGAGKSTVGRALAQATAAVYVEGDTFHPEANVSKMKAGQALDDQDRSGWLNALAAQLQGARERGHGMVVGCSALKRRYRDLLRAADPALRFAHLAGPRALIIERMQQRVDHYMPTSLLDSPLRDREPLQADEAGLALDIGATPEQLVQQILASEVKAT